MLISNGGTVIRMPVEDVKRLGRSTQGVIVMRLREGEQVSTLAPVVESETPDAGDAPTASEPAEPASRPEPSKRADAVSARDFFRKPLFKRH